MPRSHPEEFLKVFRFTIVANGHLFGASDCRWDGLHLILRRGMRKDLGAESLYHMLAGYSGVKADVAVVMYDERDAAQTWKVKYERLVDRGFDFLTAVENDIAYEAVMFVNAELKRAT